jgi:hypothetical protein
MSAYIATDHVVTCDICNDKARWLCKECHRFFCAECMGHPFDDHAICRGSRLATGQRQVVNLSRPIIHTIRFFGGPLDGQKRIVEHRRQVYYAAKWDTAHDAKVALMPPLHSGRYVAMLTRRNVYQWNG